MTVAEIGEAESDLIVDPPYFASVNGRRLLDSHEALRERAQAAEAELRALHASRDALQRERDELSEQNERRRALILDLTTACANLAERAQSAEQSVAQMTAARDAPPVPERTGTWQRHYAGPLSVPFWDRKRVE